MSSVDKIELEEKSVKEGQPSVISEDEKKFVRKLYLSVLPLIWCIIFIQFVDKSILSVASGTGLLEDTNMTPQQYNWVASIVYLGYLVYQVPNNILIQILPHSRYLGVLMILWGIVTTLTSLCNNFQQMMAVRFLLGLFESGCLPIVYIVLNTLFRRSEHSIVYGFTIISTGTGTVIGTLIGVGIIKTYGDNAWRKGYLIFGLVTIVLGILVFFLLIDHPTSKLLRLTEKEKELVKERTSDNMVVKTKEIKKYQIWESFKEPRFWCLCLATLLVNLQTSGLIAYSVLLLQSLGFNAVESVILQIPSGALSAIYTLIAIICVRKYHQSIFTGIGFSCVSIIGCIVLVTSDSTPGKLVGYYLTWAQAAPQATFITIVGNNVLGYTKKVTYNGANIIAYVIGSFVGPFFMQNYQYGIVGYIIANAIVILLLLFVRFDMARTNKRRKYNIDNGESNDEKPDVNLDLTDRENDKFIYIL